MPGKAGDAPEEEQKKEKATGTPELAGEWALFVFGLVDGLNLAFFIKCILSRRKIRKTYGWCCLLNLVVAIGTVLVFTGTWRVLSWCLDDVSAAHVTSLVVGTHSVLWKLPLFLVSYPLNYAWLVEMFDEAYKENWKVKKVPGGGAYDRLLTKLSELLLQSVLLLLVAVQTEVLRYLPPPLFWLLGAPFGWGREAWDLGYWVGVPMTLAYESWMYSFYAFVFRLDEQNLSLFKKVVYFESRWLYFLGYGLPSSALLAFISARYDPCFASIAYFVLLPVHAILSVSARPEKQHRGKCPLPIFHYANTVLAALVPTVHRALASQ